MADAGRASDWLLLAAAVLGLILAIVAYSTPESGVAGTAGALLVCFSSLALVVAGLLYVWLSHLSSWLWRMLEVLTVLGALGSAFAGYMLMQGWFTAAMLVALVASLGHFARKGAPT